MTIYILMLVLFYKNNIVSFKETFFYIFVVYLYTKTEVIYMKTNISELMNIIADEEKKFVNITSYIEERIFNETIIELDGRVNVIKDYKKDFEEAMKEQEDILKKISKLKATLYEKNNSFKLSDGRTIQDAIIDNTYLRRLKSSYDNMLKYKDSKKRITEVNNSYFDCYEVNYDSDEIRKKSKELEKQIQRTDFEISKLNSIEFEISL